MFICGTGQVVFVRCDDDGHMMHCHKTDQFPRPGERSLFRCIDDNDHAHRVVEQGGDKRVKQRMAGGSVQGNIKVFPAEMPEIHGNIRGIPVGSLMINGMIFIGSACHKGGFPGPCRAGNHDPWDVGEHFSLGNNKRDRSLRDMRP